MCSKEAFPIRLINVMENNFVAQRKKGGRQVVCGFSNVYVEPFNLNVWSGYGSSIIND